MFFVLHANVCGQSIPHHGHSHDHHHPHSHSSESLIVDAVSGHAHESGGHASRLSDNINIRAAIVHVIGDFVQSVGVLLAAILIKIKVGQRHSLPLS